MTDRDTALREGGDEDDAAGKEERGGYVYQRLDGSWSRDALKFGEDEND